MYIKLYLHPSKLINLRMGDTVIAKQMPNSQYEIEIFIDTDKYTISNQQNRSINQKENIFRKTFKKEVDKL